MTNATKVYLSLKKEVLEILADTKRFKDSKIKIFPKQMTCGKSYLQGHELLDIIKDNFYRAEKYTLAEDWIYNNILSND